MANHAVILCPGQGAQAVGMGKAWHDASPAAREVFAQADAALEKVWTVQRAESSSSQSAPSPRHGESPAETLTPLPKGEGKSLSEICFHGPAERLNQTDVSQPAIYVCSVACYRGLVERGRIDPASISASAGLSLGEYTALHLAGVFDFITGLNLVATRGRLMQQAAVASHGSMLALIGADEQQAQEVCDKATGGGNGNSGGGEVLVCANFNAPGQIVLSGHKAACERAEKIAADMGLKATSLTVAGAFHSPLMQPAADQMADALASAAFQTPNITVWSNVIAQPHDPSDMELLKKRLVQQIVSPVRWSQTCQRMAEHGPVDYHELAPGTVLRGLMRRIDRNIKVINHDQPAQPAQPDEPA